MAMQAQGREVVTIEGLGKKGRLDVLQQSFIDHDAIQCGFCTPGMVLGVKALLDEDPFPSEEKIKEALSGNLCRCTALRALSRRYNQSPGREKRKGGLMCPKQF